MNVIPEKKKKPSQKKQPIKKRKKNGEERKKEHADTINLDNEIIIGVDVLSNSKKDKTTNKKKENRNNQENQKKKVEKRKIQNNNTKKAKEEQQRLKRKKRAGILKVICSIFLFIGIIIFFMISPMLNIKVIHVEGIEKLSKEEIISLSGIEMERNMYQISVNQIEEKIKENAYVKSVQVKRKIPDKIEIVVEERHVRYMLPFGEAFVYMDSQGYLLEISDVKLEKPMILGYSTKEEELKPGNRINIEDLERLDTILKIMESATMNGIDSFITQINISNKNNYVLTLDSKGVTAYLGDASNINDRILVLKQMLITEDGKVGEAFLNDKDKMFFREKMQ